MSNGTFEFMQYTGSENDSPFDKGHDWSITYKGVHILYEGDALLTLGEAKKLCELLNRAGIWEENLGRI